MWPFNKTKNSERQQESVPIEDTARSLAGDESAADFMTDAPIEKSDQDLFRRRPWANRVAETIAAQRDPACLVVGIYGAWGDGKTSVLNLIDDSLAGTQGVVPVRFNPWRLGDEREMFQGFFATLAEALDERVASAGERVGQSLRDYGGLLAALPVVGSTLSEGAGAVGARLSETNLTKQRMKVENLLAKHQQRVVILIDDIDRLDNNEIQAMFRLVKSAADFKHTAYVLALDHRVAASALAERYADGQTHGSSFMDKIIQLPLHLPPVPADLLRTFTLEAVQSALDQVGITLTEADSAEFVSAFDRAVGPRLPTARAAKRYANALRFALPMIGREVHPVDLMLIEALRVSYPGLYEWVRSHENEALSAHPNDRTHPALLALDDATQGLAEEDVSRARVLLTTLLPRLQGAWGGDQDRSRDQEKRLDSRLYFRRYFTYTIQPGELPDAKVDSLLSAIKGSKQDATLVPLLAKELFETGAADSVLPRLASQVPILDANAAAQLAMAVTLRGDQFSNKSGPLGLSSLDRAAVLVRDLLGRVTMEERGQLATDLIRTAPLPFGVELVRWLRPQEAHPDPAGLTLAQCEATGRVLADRILSAWCSGDPFKLLSTKAGVSLQVCALYGDVGSLRGCLRKRIEKDLDFAVLLMRLFRGQAWSMETGAPLVPDLHREGYEAIGKFVDPAWLFPRLVDRFGADIGERDDRSERSLGEAERLVHQYARFYRLAADHAG